VNLKPAAKPLTGPMQLRKLLRASPDLIILDFQIPRMNGIEAAQVLRESLPDVPIVLFTLHKDIIPLSDLANLSIRAVLSKTDGVQFLADELHRLLPDP